MTRLTVTVPDELAQQAQAAGLLDELGLTTLLRRALREQSASQRLGQLLAKLDAHPEPAPSEQEIADEIAAARREHARRR
jgi:hypothetical protein